MGETDLKTVDALLALLAGQIEPNVMSVLDETSLLHVPGQSGLAGSYQGGEAIVGVLRRMADLTERTLHFAPSDTFAADDRLLVACGRSSASRGERTLDNHVAHVVLLNRNRVREMWIVHEDQSQFDEFWN